MELNLPRPREFDPEDALNSAMQVFWSKGYGETSYDDLVKGTGVSRKGLYTVFGDKHQLFVATLKNYRRTVIPALLERLGDDDIDIEGIRMTFQHLAEMAASGAGHMGCFMARTSADVSIHNEGVKEIIDLHWDDLNNRLLTALTNAGIPTERSATLAPFYVGVMQGLFTLAHARADRAVIEPFVNEALRILE